MKTPHLLHQTALGVRTTALAACLACPGCTVNFYWTDNVVYGEFNQGPDSTPKRLPAPFAPGRSRPVRVSHACVGGKS